VRPFAYRREDTPDRAVAAVLEHDDATFLGGGTNLVDLMKLGVATPATLVDVTGLPLGGVEETATGGLRIGAGVRNSVLAADPVVRRRYPVLAEALLAGASGQLRNQATVGGNLLQRTRCAYFTDVSKPCNKRAPGSGCPARTGANRELAVLGHSEDCVATHPSDMAVALAALDAVVHVQGRDGARSLALTELHRLPGTAPERDTVLEHGDLITAVELPPRPWARRSRYRKVRDRASFAFALVSIAAAIDIQDDAIAEVRIALGQVAHRPWRATAAEALLRGGPATREAFAAAAAAEVARAEPLSENGFKLTLIGNLIVTVLAELAEAA
jgi:xanthine dehydrogenase YagS FAD-binding subunit